MGYSTPEEHWVRNECPGLFRKGIARTIDVTNGLIKNEALTYFDNIVEGKIPFDFSYWRLILLGEWITRFDVKLP
jgi:asparagine synthase (glutamine-hydrolysing)